MMSLMTEWDESDITRWAEDDDPEAHTGGDAPDDLEVEHA